MDENHAKLLVYMRHQGRNLCDCCFVAGIHAKIEALTIVQQIVVTCLPILEPLHWISEKFFECWF